MRGKIVEQGHYELFISERGHRLLMLNDNSWYRWEYNSAMPKLYLTKGLVDKSGDKEYLPINQGRYYLVEATTGDFSGFQHLLFETDTFYEIYRMPTGLPSEMDFEAEIVDLKEKIPSEDVDSCFYQLSE